MSQATPNLIHSILVHLFQPQSVSLPVFFILISDITIQTGAQPRNFVVNINLS